MEFGAISHSCNLCCIAGAKKQKKEEKRNIAIKFVVGIPKCVSRYAYTLLRADVKYLLGSRNSHRNFIYKTS